MEKGRVVHLVCNAHLDPVWLWDIEEGIAEALSTFRCAVEFCEEYDMYVFNHNEALLYDWVRLYEPELFERIQRLEAAGKWHIMGGWFVQPDCNMPSGESLIRQITVGREFFSRWFTKVPTTAVNVDSFGHDRGLVQILTRSGYDSYLICRPTQAEFPLKQADFIWSGYDQSEILVHRSDEWYSSSRGKAAEKIEKLLSQREDNPLLILWGVGDHGGGASRKDLDGIKGLMESSEEDLRHSTPEAYFKERISSGSCSETISRVETDLRPWGVGCYTSMTTVKQGHKELENLYYSTEKLVAAACMNGLISWPKERLEKALKDLLFIQFHDILPGSSVREVEKTALEILGRACSELRSIRTEAILALAAGPETVADGEIPIYVCNPHPWEFTTDIMVEFLLTDYNWEDSITIPTIVDSHGTVLATQLEKESANLAVDWRKRVVFRAELSPLGVTRYICKLTVINERQVPEPEIRDNQICMRQSDMVSLISLETGLITSIHMNGVEYLKEAAGTLGVYRDQDDPWGISLSSFQEKLYTFKLADRKTAARLCGNGTHEIEPVRMIEDGPVRSVIEAIFTCGSSWLIRRYTAAKEQQGLNIDDELFWDGPGCMLKCEFPTNLTAANYLGQGAFGHSQLPNNGNEAVSRDWVAAIDKNSVFSILTGSTYGSDFKEGLIRINYLRTAAYAAHPVAERPLLVQDRYIPRIDTGLHRFSSKILPGEKTLLKHIDKLALQYMQVPYALSCFPSYRKNRPAEACVLEGDALVTALYRSPSEDSWVIRLYNPTGEQQEVVLRFPSLTKSTFLVQLDPWEIRSSLLHDTQQFGATDLIVTTISAKESL